MNVICDCGDCAYWLDGECGASSITITDGVCEDRGTEDDGKWDDQHPY